MIFGCVETTCDTMFNETNDYQKEQVDLDLVDDEEAPCDALQRIAIGDIRPQDSSDQLQGQSPNDITSPEQELDQDKHEEDSTMIKSKRRAMMGKMRMMGIMEKHHHIQ
jgi:hypothetical protein